ncbi:hypothetical protein BEP19_08765 [Ammoniphilus oxalaticus]|uniref:DUF2512 family protein n=1 Tax=Ammoniphilus oxalaticus TaxID=66863 RepID=A0A419SKJ7_9BACL|nr:DUF2512 family protein [Ammoniphilus oxalaticus]RKD24469.1 hypothetical protein BEP19_08765 [Ammoniphilus oxalaticus]
MKRWIGKLLLYLIVIVPFLLWLTDKNFLTLLITVGIFSIFSYVLSDRIMWELSSDSAATWTDVFLAFIYFWLIPAQLGWPLPMLHVLGLVVIVGLIEYGYHRVLEKEEQPIHKNE